jgi:hypothetical protein
MSRALEPVNELLKLYRTSVVPSFCKEGWLRP